MKEIFDKKFVHFMWGDSLKGKEGFFADYIDKLVDYVENEKFKFKLTCEGPGDSEYPFLAGGTRFCFFYYDPLYNVKLAWKQGKTIQGRTKLLSDPWVDCCCPTWSDECEYRVKPEKKWRPFKNIKELKDTWHKCAGLCEPPPLFEPMIWVRDKKRPDITRLITGFNGGINSGALAGSWNSLEALFDDYTFLDGTPCGVEE